MEITATDANIVIVSVIMFRLVERLFNMSRISYVLLLYIPDDLTVFK